MLAKVSIVIVVVFIACHSIKWIPNIYELIQRMKTEMKEEVKEEEEEKDVEWPLWIESVTQFSHFLTVLNSSVNFYIYFATHYEHFSYLNVFSSLWSSRERSQQRPTTTSEFEMT